ncbi:MAG: MEKHLA domain-containing protein [Nitrospirae bacterium]|nr:MEKHLA domain-containing protein [Nitrospirota bacterium]
MAEPAHNQKAQDPEPLREPRAPVYVLLLTVFLRILAIGAVADVVASLIAELLGLSPGGMKDVVGILIFSGVMAPLLYVWVGKDMVRRFAAQQQQQQQQQQEMLAATARERDYRAQLALQNYVETVVASVPSSLLVLSTDLIVRSVSLSFRDLFGIGDRDVVGQPVEKVLPLVGVWKLVAEVLGSDEPRRKVSVDVRDPVRNLDFHVTLTKLQQPYQDARLLLVVEDITERKRLLEQVETSRARFWGIVDAASDAILSVDEHRKIVVFNQQAEGMFGYAAREVIGQPLEMLLPSRFRGGHRAVVEGFQRQNADRQNMSDRPILLGLRKNGEEFPVEITISKLVSDGKPLMTAIVRDVSERQRAERELRESKEALQDFLDNATDLVQNVGADGRFVYVNRAWLRTLGYTPEEVEGLTVFDIIHPESRAHCQDLFQRVIAGESIKNFETVFVAKDGRRIPVEGNADSRSHEGAVFTRAIFRDMTERKLAEERLNHLAHYDSLTGLPNRLLFADRLTHELAQARRAKQMVGLLFLDLDGFKPVNDSLGHDVGDLLLKAAAQRLAGSVRASDTVARLGGDEFTVILHDLNPVEGAAVVAQKILHALSQPFVLEGREVSVTASIGITVYPLDGETVEGLLKNADTAMYRAKAQAGSYRFFAPETQGRVTDRLTLVQDLHRALERGELVLRYQPYVALATRRLVGGQAHVQWEQQTVIIPQQDLMRVAQDAGLIAPITEWMVRTACADARAWQSPESPLVRVAVHLSRQQFAQAHIVDSVVRALRETGLDPRCLDLELAEGIFMPEAESTAVKLQALHALGLTLSIADFGTGYSSLGDLKQFSIEGLKIGRDFVCRLTTDSDRAAIVSAIIAMAHGLKMTVVAEGVEDEAQVAWLRAQGCDMIQGDLVGRPVPAETFVRFLEAGGGSERRAA